MDKSSSIVWCDLPRAGLGNQLFPLLKAYVFGNMNKIPVVVTGYHQLKLGPYLRGERTKRNYSQNFKFQKNILGLINDTIAMSLRRRVGGYQQVDEPDLTNRWSDSRKTIFRFSKIPHWKDFFAGLRENRSTVVDLFWGLLDERIKQAAFNLPAPIIGVHVRLGDFRRLLADEDFKKVGAVRTPTEYFANMIKGIREKHGVELPVSIFSDGYEHELSPLSSLVNTNLISGNRDILDLILLSRSKIIVTSAGSTFGYWAGFLSNAPIIMHPDHINAPLRGFSDPYEGPLNFLPQGWNSDFMNK